MSTFAAISNVHCYHDVSYDGFQGLQWVRLGVNTVKINHGLVPGKKMRFTFFIIITKNNTLIQFEKKVSSPQFLSSMYEHSPSFSPNRDVCDTAKLPSHVQQTAPKLNFHYK